MNNNKIGCVIAYRNGHNNYGTALQAYAMLKKMQEWGYDCEVIYYVKRLTPWQKIAWVANALRVGEAKTICRRFRNWLLLKTFPNYATNIGKRTEAVDAYKKQYLQPLFHEYVGYEALCSGSRNYAVVIVGSDQVWTPLSLPNKFFNLLFVADNVPKVAYASSFGVSEIPTFQRGATGAYLKRFKNIGVREVQGKEIVESLSGKKATVVVDPTLLLSREEWEKEMAGSDINVQEPYIFCYFLGTNQEARRVANTLKARTGYRIVSMRHMDEYVNEDKTFGDEAPYDVDPNGWVKLIANASYVCTDSFHCLAFSILFHRRFLLFYRFSQTDRTGRNSRIDSLLHILGIGSEYIFTGDNLANIDILIDYKEIDARLAKMRSLSMNFLKGALEKSMSMYY